DYYCQSYDSSSYMIF
nr:immunoglobulin light chain junction region [Macaca mulatta]MOW66680.1 immunoglobulin light chain junction region [Macaca mulatta]MOW67899.1 immunoglobulin light chain junction region [Macaca mulatta]MOW68449.1 immunoglobulin light chain junction region [Macaca mulatta]MOW69501.1 immunoglobulin light chain junction region [Macaca mulatta]